MCFENVLKKVPIPIAFIMSGLNFVSFSFLVMYYTITQVSTCKINWTTHLLNNSMLNLTPHHILYWWP